MTFNYNPELDVPGERLTLSHPYDPHSMTFLHRGQTQPQVVNALYMNMYTPIIPGKRIYILASEAWFVLTFIACAMMLLKRRHERIWLVTTKQCAYGSFYAANTVLCLVVGVTLYLFAWNSGIAAMAAFSYAGTSMVEWIWIVPAPWWPLVVFAYISIHGYIPGCSPKSPLASRSVNKKGMAPHT